MAATNKIQPKSLVKDGKIFFDKNFLSKDEADALFHLLNDDTKFKSYKLYFYDHDKDEITSVKNHRQSYWFGDYAQAVQTAGKMVTSRRTGKKIHVPTDFVEAHVFPPEILALKERIEKEYGVQFNSCLVGRYSSPRDKIGFHTDASANMGDDPHIGSVSFGRARRFDLKKQDRYCRRGEKEEVSVVLTHGSLVVMRDGANLKYLHAVPPDPKCSEEDCRINLTFRNYKYHPDEMNHPAPKGA